MKLGYYVLVLALLTFSVFMMFNQKPAEADIYTPLYLWQDSVSVSTTTIDSTFDVRWEELSIWSIGCSVRLKVGAPDTTSWSSRDFVHYSPGQVFSIGTNPKIKRLEFGAVSGTGTLYMVGLKKVPQY